MKTEDSSTLLAPGQSSHPDYDIFLSPPHLAGNEIDLVKAAIESKWIAPLGPQVDAFEEEFRQYLSIEHAVALASGTAALHIAMRLLGIGPGDRVLCPTLTFVATANPIRYEGAEPVFIDSEERSWNLDPQLLEEELMDGTRRNRRPAAVVAVDIFGQSADYDAITEICGRYQVPLIEDAAEALGADYKERKVGVFGELGVFSFNGNKIITTSGGGMLVSHSKEYADKARHLATQARDPAPHYEHSTIGYNYRLSNILAALGRGQLGVLEERVEKRRSIFETYRRGLGDLPGIDFMPEADYGRSTRWLTCLTIDPEAFGADRHKVMDRLKDARIESRPLWKPLHLQPVFQGCRIRGGRLAEAIFQQGLCLPSGSSLTSDQQIRIIELVRSCCR